MNLLGLYVSWIIIGVAGNIAASKTKRTSTLVVITVSMVMLLLACIPIFVRS